MSNLTPNLDYVLYYVAEIEIALDYFKNKLGFGHLAEQDAPTFRQLTSGNGIANIGLSLAGPATPPAGSVVVYFKTPDIGGLHEAVTGRGANPSPIMELPFGPVFMVNTPDHTPLAILSDPK